MERIWTEAQSAAINIHHKTLLVSAAAGSGKTATLTERIIRSITDPKHPSDISKMLIVTFTRAAAEELKSRIFAALSDALAKDPTNRHLTNQLIKLGSANICTIDSFCLNLLRSNFSALGLPAAFRIADETELELLSISAMEEAIEVFYETDPLFPSFAECFTGTRSADQLASILIHLEQQSNSIPQGIEFFRMNAEQTRVDAEKEVDFFATSFGKILREHAINTVTHAHSIFSAACDYITQHSETADALFAAYDYDRTFCEALLGTLQNPNEGYEFSRRKLQAYEPLSLKRLKKEYVTEETEQFKALRTAMKDEIRALSKKFFAKSQDTLRRAMKDTADYTELLYRVLFAYHKTLNEQKRIRKILDFNDIRRYTFKLLIDDHGTPTPIAQQYAKEFSDIYIDEYQDVDLVQDQIFAALATPTNRFMVGDIKQSIYGFRGAEPKVFGNYRAAFPDYEDVIAKHSDVATIFMSENFRCDEPIIKFTNLICGKIFSACAQNIDYQPKDDLVYSKGRFDPRENPALVEVAVISTQTAAEDEGEESTSQEDPPVAKELEAAYIAEEIERLIREEKKANGKPILPGDIAVLFRSRTMSPYVAKALQNRGILCSESDSGRYFENPDVLMILCLLNTVDNPHRDIFFAGTLRSPLFGFDMNEILEIRASAAPTYSLYDALLERAKENDELAEKCRHFDSNLQMLRRDARSMPVDQFLRLLFESDRMIASGLLSDISAGSEGGNLLRLYDYARTFEAGSFKGLYNFIEFINTLIEEEKTMKIPPKGSSPDRVNLMTIHQSKGLEFPVCFVCGTASRFNRQDQKANFLFEYPSGVAMKIADTTGFARINTPMRESLAVGNGIRQTEEEMRVLYVALTRARERLYVTASTASTKEKLQKKAHAQLAFCDQYTILRSNSYLEWILLPFADPNANTTCAHLSFITPVEIDAKNSEKEVKQKTEKACLPNAELLSKLQANFAFQYPNRDLQRIPAKLSVSRLSPSILDENDDSVDLFTEKKTPIPDFFLSGKLSQVTPAERGTATHLFLEFCDFGYAERHGAKAELDRLVEKKFLSENLADILYLEELESFLQSDLFREIQSAKQIIREQRFNLLLSPDSFTQDAEFRAKLKEEHLAVQGVIDLILVDQNGDVSLFDYKTDRLTKEERTNPSLAQKALQDRHGLQLSYYTHAIEQLFGRPCKNVCVYSTHAGKLFEIEPMPLMISGDLLDTL